MYSSKKKKEYGDIYFTNTSMVTMSVKTLWRSPYSVDGVWVMECADTVEKEGSFDYS